MNQKPCDLTQSDLAEDVKVEVPDEIMKKIKNAWVTGLISIGITLASIVSSLFGTTAFFGITFRGGLTFLMCIFTFGTYKKSRVCAVLMFLLFLADKIITFIIMLMKVDIPELWVGLPVGLIFLWFYSLGVVGTFQYHRFIKESLNKPMRSAAKVATG